ncbi:MAG: hypothetical protein AAF702_30305 [Chloroflexota bacterium]
MTLTVLPFQDKHVDAAAQLLAARQKRDRLVLPQLPSRFEDLVVARKALELAYGKPWSSGSVALADGQVVGYLLGTPRFDQHTGRTVWIRPAGYALADGVDVELMRDLYAHAGPAWLELGCFDHYAMISTADRTLLDSWYSLCFGQQQVYGLYQLADFSEADFTNDKAPIQSDITIRRATVSDGPYLAQLCYITAEHQFRAPTWAPTPREIVAGRPNSYSSVASDDEAIAWLAFKGGQSGHEAVGFQIYYEAEPEADDLYIPERCIELSAAGMVSEVRSMGIGLALSLAGFTHAKQSGYAHCLADWRTANLQASRFWLKHGFKSVVYRLHRRVDERILWANHI